ncbi:unnamed protein product [Strongylus vulgaris]|uniref:Uncharacterized protein n=1 Tax=Strongylus vulgaris TaxID=40348 RepID=A0A3P7K5Y2_STRVU|nr:unnamed protein product [Strongylus vulgaris]
MDEEDIYTVYEAVDILKWDVSKMGKKVRL